MIPKHNNKMMATQISVKREAVKNFLSFCKFVLKKKKNLYGEVAKMYLYILVISPYKFSVHHFFYYYTYSI